MSSLAVRVLSSADHLDRLRVMADHPLHELHVGGGVLHLRQVGGSRHIQHATVLSGRARLNDGGTALRDRRARRAGRRWGIAGGRTTRSHGNNGQEKGGAAE